MFSILKKPPRTLVVALLVVISIFSITIRIQYLATVRIIHPVRADALQYVNYAQNLALNGTFSSTDPRQTRVTPDSLRSPGYPLFLAAAIKLSDTDHFYFPALFSQALLGGLMPVLTYLIAITALPFAAAIAAVILVALSPHLVTISSYFLTEALFGFTLLAAICLLSHAVRKNHWLLYTLSALACGFAYLINEAFLLLPYLLAGLTYLTRERKNRGRKQAHNLIFFVAIFSLFPMTWTIRNAVNVPAGVPRASNRAISTLSHGAYPDFIHKTARHKYYPYREDPRQPEFGTSLTGFMAVLSQRVRKNPMRYFTWYCLKKPIHLWQWDILQGQGDIYIYEVRQSLYFISPTAAALKAGMHTLHPLIVFLAFAGLPVHIALWLRSRRQVPSDAAVLIVYTTFFYFTLLYTIFVPWPRYAVPLRPILYLCALWSLVHFLSGFIKRLPGSTPA